MTRIIAGTARGRRLSVPPAGTRPTSDRVREALFDALAARMDFDDLRVLDLYAGSGALGLEALSRGASEALFVESDRRAAQVIRRNIEVVGTGRATVRTGTVESVTRTPGTPHDLVFLDPPYVVDSAVVAGVLAELTTRGWLAADAVVVVERSSRSPGIVWPEALAAAAERRYGETAVQIAHHRPDDAADSPAAGDSVSQS
ncbi:16S rRNA (guanine(966)-N(2))-methyltransferase RsmD [Millisia brevis]|uniref:16S rRNA (guanine(966)-N(2))-methyltransferase RsmD n=1 Tax=Millisia brevis TaxID=264148 RepID=UPI0008377596|nr:16S rRNA (guanine(966)-N(2))-methyltransferase RsmD [Millisia brevis]